MALLYDINGNPIRNYDAVGNDTLIDTRPITLNLAAVNAEIAIDLQGESTLAIDTRGTFVGTMLAEFTIDGTNYNTNPLPIHVQATELYQPSITTVGQFLVDIPKGTRRIRLRMSAYTSGTAIVALRATKAKYIVYSKTLPLTSINTTTAASGATATLTLPAPGLGMYHYIGRLVIERHTSALLTAGATPVIVTTTNLPGSLAFSIPADAAPQGQVYREVVEMGGQPLKSSAANTATTIVAPAVTGIIWRLTAYYYNGA